MSCRKDEFPDGVSDEMSCPDAGVETRPVDIGVTFGGALDIPAGGGSVVVDLRGNVGIRSIDDSPRQLDFRNRMISLMVGYRFLP
jgi:hypothetical protein